MCLPQKSESFSIFFRNIKFVKSLLQTSSILSLQHSKHFHMISWALLTSFLVPLSAYCVAMPKKSTEIRKQRANPRVCYYQRWSRGHKARGQGHKKISRPRTDPLEAKAKDQGHRRKSSPKKKKENKGLQIFFQAISKKKVFKNFFSGDLYLRKPKKKSSQIFRKVSGVFQRNFNGPKIVLYSSRGQGNFQGLEA